MHNSNIKEEAHRLLDDLPKSATWNDLMYKIYVSQAIEAGLEDSQAGRTIDVKNVRAKFDGLVKSPISPPLAGGD